MAEHVMQCSLKLSGLALIVFGVLCTVLHVMGTLTVKHWQWKIH